MADNVSTYPRERRGKRGTGHPGKRRATNQLAPQKDPGNGRRGGNPTGENDVLWEKGAASDNPKKATKIFQLLHLKRLLRQNTVKKKDDRGKYYPSFAGEKENPGGSTLRKDRGRFCLPIASKIGLQTRGGEARSGEPHRAASKRGGRVSMPIGEERKEVIRRRKRLVRHSIHTAGRNLCCVQRQRKGERALRSRESASSERTS